MPEQKKAQLERETFSVKKTEVQTRQKTKYFPIVAIGGSAGAFPALESFFTHMPSDSGMGFVIIMHLSPDHKGHMADVIGNYTAMPVREAVDGMPIEPNHVYVIPPNKDMGIHNRKLLLLGITKHNGFRHPIDYFFQTLADDQWNRSVGVVLSGMGSDGETGVRMIKEKLGLVMVQDPETAGYDSMPRASIGTNMVDYVLAPEEMPIKLIQYLNHPVFSDETEEARSDIRDSNSVQKILMLLRSQTGHDFSLYKKSTVIRRIDRRIAFHQLPDYGQYVNYLRENPKEIEILFNELLIGVTKFFRDAPAFDSLKRKLENLIQHKKDTDPIRVWVAGCSTGEEAYSIAILLIESLDVAPSKKLPKIQIFATDLDLDAIEQARRGNYHENIAADVSPKRLERFFVKSEQGYTVKKELREMIVFAQHNLIKDAPFTRVDLISCRNVMIYLTGELQKKIIPIFHYSLNARGIMFMGPAETIGGFTDMFLIIDPKWKIFERKDGSASSSKMIDFPFHVTHHPVSMSRLEETQTASAKISAADTFNKVLLENFTPTALLINEKGDILYTNGKSSNHMQLPRGEAVMNIHKMVREELRYVLGNVIHQARNQKVMVSINDVKLTDGKASRLVDLYAEDLREMGLPGLMLVVIEDKGLTKKNSHPRGEKDAGDRQVIQDLEKELAYTKQQLHSTIEQMETSLEELKSSNEELQSTNEELQSTNEESLTTKEEMQSLNEELMTVNSQYESKAEELNRLTNDMKNLLDATEIGTVFLNNDLEILRYTPQIKKLFNIIPADVGRPLSDIVSNFDFGQLKDTIKEVIDRLATNTIEVRTKTNDWYTVRVMPYRTLDNYISGVVMTFTLVTDYKQMEFRLKALQNYSTSMMSRLQQPALQLDKDLKVISANNLFREMFLIKSKDLEKISFEHFALAHWQAAELGTKLAVACETGKPTNGQFSFKGVTYELSASPFVDEETREILLVLVTINRLKDT